MAAIGGVTCTYVHTAQGAVPSALKLRAEVWTVPGLSGIGAAQLGYQDGQFVLTAVYYSNDSGVDLWAASLQAKQGTLVSITDDHGDTFTNCLLVEVGNVTKRPAYVPGSGVTTRGEIQIQGIKAV